MHKSISGALFSKIDPADPTPTKTTISTSEITEAKGNTNFVEIAKNTKASRIKTPELFTTKTNAVTSTNQSKEQTENNVTARNDGENVHNISAEDMNSNVQNTTKAVTKEPSCPFHRNIFHLKIHQTGSSTLNNILERMVLKYGLKQVPVLSDPFPSRDPLSLVMRPPGNATSLGPYEVFNDHTLYTEDIDTIMADNTTFIASIRFPLTQLRALFEEFRISEQLNITSPDPVLTFLENLPQYGSQLVTTRNIHALYFGLHSESFDNQTELDNLISFIEEKYSSIVVMEYFLESLVLLRRRMCWSVSDIVHLIQRDNSHSTLKDAVIPWHVRHAHHNYSHADYSIYDALTKKMFQEIPSQKYFWDEVDTLKRITGNLAAFCQPFLEQLKDNTSSIYDIENGNATITFNPYPWGEPFTIFSVDCAIMKLDTTVFRNNVKVRQMPELCTSPSIQRKLRTESLQFDIHWENETLVIHEKYCQEMHPRFKIPMAVLADESTYMWLDWI